MTSSRFFSICSLLFVLTSCNNPPSVIVPKSKQTFREVLDSLNISVSEDFVIYVDKSTYTLDIKLEDKKLVSYPIVLGGNPIGDKRREGDQKTPEGIFKVRSKFEHNKWNKFIWVDYPNEDSERKFRNSIENGEIPENSSIGGEIGIHGVPEGKNYLIDQKVNWTLGCVSLKNHHIDEFYEYIDLATWQIEIVP